VSGNKGFTPLQNQVINNKVKVPSFVTGFTLLELIVVIVIIGILGTLGFAQYQNVIEKSRTAEGVGILGLIRKAQEAYHLEYNKYTNITSDLAITRSNGTYFQDPVGYDEHYPTDTKKIVGQVQRKTSPPIPGGSVYWLYINMNGTIFCDDGLGATCGKKGCKGLGYEMNCLP